MVRTYKSKAKGGRWWLDDLQRAVNYVVQEVWKIYVKDIRHSMPDDASSPSVSQRRTGSGRRVAKKLDLPNTINADRERQLLILDMQRILSGWTKMDVRRLWYRYCESNEILHNFNCTVQCAGDDWQATLMKNTLQPLQVLTESKYGR